MSEQLKMDLRPKRRPRYRASEEQDPDNPSYARQNYQKLGTNVYTHESVPPSIVLNLNAKLLAKFINKTNKSIRDIRLSKEESQKELIKKDNIPKDKIIAQPMQNPKKQSQATKNQKTEPPKKSKQLYNFKELHQNSELIKNLTQQQVLKGVKNIENLSGLINNKGIYSGPLSNQLSQLQSLYPNLKDLNYQSLTQAHNPDLFQFDQKQQPKTTQKKAQQSTSNLGSNKPQRQSTRQMSKPKSQPKRQNPAKVTNPESKIFKRSAYHVAIAYHIYLKGLYEQGITSGNEIDPTYRARVIKQQAGMVNDDE